MNLSSAENQPPVGLLEAFEVVKVNFASLKYLGMGVRFSGWLWVDHRIAKLARFDVLKKALVCFGCVLACSCFRFLYTFSYLI